MQLRFWLHSVAYMHVAVPVWEDSISNVVHKLTDFWSFVEEEFAKRGIASKDGFAPTCRTSQSECGVRASHHADERVGEGNPCRRSCVA